MQRLSILASVAAVACLGISALAEPPVSYVVSVSEAPSYEIGKGSGMATLLLNRSTGANDVGMSLLDLNPGAAVPPHQHPESTEALFILEGVVEMTIKGKPYRAKAGDAIYIPRGVEHSAVVPKDGRKLKALQAYIGPGPEQRFTKGRLVVKGR